MRVEDGSARSRATPAGDRRFVEALRDARGRAPVGRTEARARAQRAAGSTGLATPLASRRVEASRASLTLRVRRVAFGDVERDVQRASAQPMAPGLPVQPQPLRAEATAELRAVVRALPVAIEAARVREGEPLSLALGRALSVDLRRGPLGVEVILRPEAALLRAASAELPALVAALRARGIAVARADVRSQAGAGRPDGRPAR